MRSITLFLVVIGLLNASAQSDPLAERHARISDLYEAEKYAETIREIDLQVKAAAGTTWQDSLHHYLYKYGRANRKLKGTAAGVDAAEQVYALVKDRGNANHMITALFDLSWTYYDVGEIQQCARVDSTAVEVADRSADVSISLRGRARQYLAFDYSVLGDHRNSAKYALQAIAQYEQDDSIPPAQRAESYTAAGVAYWHMGRIRDAEAFYLKALGILGDSEEQTILIRKVSTNGNLGVLWQNAGDLTRAKTYYYESLRYSDRVITETQDPFTRDEAIVNRSRTYLNLATVYDQLGDVGRARELMDIAWKDRSGVLEPDDPQLLVVRDRLAELEINSGALDRAQELVTAYAIACEKKFGRQSEEYIRATTKLGDIAVRKGENARADSLFRLGLVTTRTSTSAGTDPVRVLALQGRARMNLKAERFKDVLADLQEAREITVNIYDSAHFKVAYHDVLLAEAAYLARDLRSSIVHSSSALALLKGRIQMLRSSNAPLAFPDPHLLPEAIYWNVKARHELGGTIDPEWNRDLDLAIGALARNKATLEDHASKLLLIGSQKRLFDLAMDLAYEAYVKSGAEADIERFLQLSEADRSILLKSRLNAFAGLRFAGVPDSTMGKEQELITALDIDPDDRAAASDMDRREKAYADFLVKLERDHPSYFQLRYGESSITLRNVRDKLLTRDRRLLAYARTGDQWYVLVVSLDTAAIIRLDGTGIPEASTALNAAIASRNAQEYVEQGERLHRLIFKPVAPLLACKELLIIPDGSLHAVNFETLLTSPDRKDFRDNMLLQRYSIAYLLSATTAVQFVGLARDRAKGVLAIAPGFTDGSKRDYLASIKDTALVDRHYLDYVRQPFAVNTARDLGRSLSAMVMVEGDANEKGFREQAARYGILHLGTHAEMNATSPMYSRLVLSKDGSGVDPDADGYLHAYEIYEMDLRAQLAVLTACETGTGKNDQGEGVRSLGYGFAYAGCPSLVMSLWSIDEKVSAEIIERFYTYIAEGMPKHLALRQAKLDHLALAQDELALPYYWAGLVLVGDVEPVVIGHTWKWYAGWGIGPFALLVILVLLFKRRRA